VYTYKAHITRIVDGDTVKAKISLGFSITVDETFRIKDIDTPETHRPKSEAERIHGRAATARAKELLEGKEVIITTYKTGKYGRYIASIELSDGSDFGSVMIAEGFQKRTDYLPDP